MNIYGIEIPKQIIEALNNDKLVVFAGAGVSMGHPTNLPSFKKLTDLFTKGRYENLIKIDQAYNENDQYLGRLETKNINVHQAISQIFGSDDLLENDYHKALINLFAKNKKLRIVTTNYDKMLEKVATQAGLDFDVYSNPALPYGDDFDGIVHIHGQVDDPKNIVATDRDFGKAYMYQSNVSRFLSALFNSDYVVLFVGYSYNDLIMRYFTKAIPESSAPRYIFADDLTLSSVKSLGLSPIYYPLEDFKTMYKAINELGDFINRDAFSWENRILEISNANPNFLDIHTEEELKHILNNIHLMDKFLSKVNSLSWLIYFNYKGYLDRIFKDKDFNDFDYIFSKWILDNFLRQEFDEFKYLLVKHDFKLNINFQKMIIDHLHLLEEDKIEEILSFIKIDQMDENILLEISKILDSTHLSYYKGKVFRSIINLVYEYRKLSTFLEEGKNKKIEIFARPFIPMPKLKEEFDKYINLDKEGLLQGFKFMSSQLINLYNKSSLGDIDHNFSNYKIFTKDQVGSDMDFYLMIMVQISRKLEGDKELWEWSLSNIGHDFGVLRRLSRVIYLENTDQVRMDCILKKVRSEDEAKEIVDLLEGYKDIIDKTDEYEAFKQKYALNNKSTYLNKEDLINRPDLIIPVLLGKEDQVRSRESILKDISDLISLDYDLGFEAINALVENKNNDPEVWDHVLKGLSDNENLPGLLDQVLDLISDKEVMDKNTFSIALFLKKLVEKTPYEKYRDHIEGLISYLENLFNYGENSAQNERRIWSDMIYKSSYGVLAHIGVKLLQRNNDSRDSFEDYKKIQDKLLDLASKMLKEDRAFDAIYVIAGNLSLLFTIDNKWAKDNLLGYFESDKDEEFELAWKGFLIFSRIYPQISLLMEDKFTKAISRLDQIEESGRFRKEFIRAYTLHTLANVDYPLNSHIQPIFSLKKEDILNFYKYLNQYVSELNLEIKDKVWKYWIKDFLDYRVNNIPRIFETYEIGPILELSINLGLDDNDICSKLDQYEDISYDFIDKFDAHILPIYGQTILANVLTLISENIVSKSNKQPDRKVLDFINTLVGRMDKDQIPYDLAYNLKILGI